MGWCKKGRQAALSLLPVPDRPASRVARAGARQVRQFIGSAEGESIQESCRPSYVRNHLPTSVPNGKGNQSDRAAAVGTSGSRDLSRVDFTSFGAASRVLRVSLVLPGAGIAQEIFCRTSSSRACAACS